MRGAVHSSYIQPSPAQPSPALDVSPGLEIYPNLEEELSNHNDKIKAAEQAVVREEITRKTDIQEL